MKKTHQQNLKIYNEYQMASMTGKVEDDNNPVLIFSTTWLDVLSKIAKGEVDAQWLAKKELANRGYNLDGKWVGFEKAGKENF